MKKSKKIEKDKANHHDGYFDDCSICQAMKKAGIKMRDISDDDFYATEVKPENLKEIKKAFKKAQDKGAIVGGEWFEEK
ncbi:MAG: hypothetical protein U5L76_01445 [Patescibacteria group bacterium]|nr:hypothetical protein [Patescibacteria group bacterium]